MPKFLENKLMREAAAKGLSKKRAAAYTFGTMNNLGLMHGSKETAKGRAAEVKHARQGRREVAPVKPKAKTNRNALRARMGL